MRISTVIRGVLFTPHRYNPQRGVRGMKRNIILVVALSTFIDINAHADGLFFEVAGGWGGGSHANTGITSLNDGFFWNTGFGYFLYGGELSYGVGCNFDFFLYPNFTLNTGNTTYTSTDSETANSGLSLRIYPYFQISGHPFDRIDNLFVGIGVGWGWNSIFYGAKDENKNRSFNFKIDCFTPSIFIRYYFYERAYMTLSYEAEITLDSGSLEVVNGDPLDGNDETLYEGFSGSNHRVRLGFGLFIMNN